MQARERSKAVERTRTIADAVGAPRRGQLVVAEQPAGDDGDVEVLGERLAELGQQVRRRLDSRPVVLVEDEHAGLTALTLDER